MITIIIQMPKLAVVGPHDSGKTSWAYIFRGVMPREHIGTISHEAVFALMNINENTLIVIVDEFGKTSVPTNILKEAFGGKIPLVIIEIFL